MIRMPKFSFLKVSVLLVFALSVAGCAAQPPVPSDKYYRLQAVFAGSAATLPKFSGTFEVERFTADGLTAGRPIVYVDAGDPNRLQEYHYHFWTQAPTIMLRDELVTYLRASKIADSVVTPEMRLEPSYVMTGRIRKLEQVIGSTNATHLEMEMSVRRTSDGELLFLKSYAHETKQSSTGVASAVDAFNESINIIFSDLYQDLSAL